MRAPVTIEAFAAAPLILYDSRWGAEDPTRRVLLERAQRAGVRIEPVIEVEQMRSAIELAARGLGDTVIAQRSALRRGAMPASLRAVGFAEPLFETLAFITRRGVPRSPAARELMALAEQQLGALRE